MPTIEFTTYDKECSENWRPVLAKKVVPDWWKTMKVQENIRGNKTQTIRSCPAMDDWLKTGWLICAKRDMEVTVSEHGNHAVTDKTNRDHSPTHPAGQAGHHFTYLSKEDSPTMGAFKMKAPWNIITPPGYSCLYLDPFLFQNKYFATWQGMIDTDAFNVNMDNSQIIFYPKTNKNFTIKEGTPLVQIIPYRRENWKASYITYDTKSWQENRSGRTTHRLGEEGDKLKTMDEWNRSPELRESKRMVEGIAGAYRRIKYWNEKGRMFKEDNPPPECPMHNPDLEEHKAEIQLDLFGDQDDS